MNSPKQFPTKIHDQFTDLPVSRQRKYQLRKMARGLCAWAACQEPLATGSYCVAHAQQSSAASMRYRQARRNDEAAMRILR